jgi:hypothetical protein
MGAATVSDAEAIQLIQTAQAQLEEYLRLARIASGQASATVFNASPSYSWDNPMSLTVSTAPNAIVVCAPGST